MSLNKAYKMAATVTWRLRPSSCSPHQHDTGARRHSLWSTWDTAQERSINDTSMAIKQHCKY